MDLELVQALEALQVSTRGTPASLSREQEESLETQYNLLLMIPENQGSRRPITIHQVSQDLHQAWGTRYAAVSTVAGPFFLATFQNSADMMHIITRQPWLVRRHNVLLELYVPNKPLEQYRFDFLYANVRLYGLPFEARTPHMIDAILRQIGQPSDLDEQLEFNIQRDEFYALVRAKLNVNRPAVDKLFFPISENRRIIVFIHYERISRICSFCGGFFHNKGDCMTRTARILNPANESNDPPNDPYGRWMTRLRSIPWDYVIHQVRHNVPRVLQPSTVLSNLRAQHVALTAAAQGHRTILPPANTTLSAHNQAPAIDTVHLSLQVRDPHPSITLTTQQPHTQPQDTPMTESIVITTSTQQPSNVHQHDPMQWQATTMQTTATAMPAPHTTHINDQDMSNIQPSAQLPIVETTSPSAPNLTVPTITPVPPI